MTITYRRLLEALAYELATGLFRWRVRASNRVKVGDVAGNLMKTGRVQIHLDGENHLAHRLAWFYVFGEWPRHVIDHINGDPSDNRLANLRDVTTKINNQNRRAAGARSSTGLLGAFKYAHGFRSQIMVDGVLVNLGTFDTAHAAHAAYLAAKRQMHDGNTL